MCVYGARCVRIERHREHSPTCTVFLVFGLSTTRFRCHLKQVRTRSRSRRKWAILLQLQCAFKRSFRSFALLVLCLYFSFLSSAASRVFDLKIFLVSMNLFCVVLFMCTYTRVYVYICFRALSLVTPSYFWTNISANWDCYFPDMIVCLESRVMALAGNWE